MVVELSVSIFYKDAVHICFSRTKRTVWMHDLMGTNPNPRYIYIYIYYSWLKMGEAWNWIQKYHTNAIFRPPSLELEIAWIWLTTLFVRHAMAKASPTTIIIIYKYISEEKASEGLERYIFFFFSTVLAIFSFSVLFQPVMFKYSEEVTRILFCKGYHQVYYGCRY